MAVTLSMIIIMALTMYIIEKLDESIYPGARILSQDKLGNILEISIAREIDDGSDGGCLKTAKIILAICKDGYRVFYWGRVIDLEQAEELVALNGSPEPEILDNLK